jgi:predicted MFS family arabinose efflux permease
MKSSASMRVAAGGLLAMAAGMGIGRFVYTPILPEMIVGLNWSKLDAGLVASANFFGYLIGALTAGLPAVAARPRAWLIAALATSSLTTLVMAAFTDLAVLASLRLLGGIASAFVIICGSAIVLERLAAAGQARLAAVHFAGVGAGIVTSAIVVGLLSASGAAWTTLWIITGLIAAIASVLAVALVPSAPPPSNRDTRTAGPLRLAPIAGLTAAHGLFGFGYVITATFLVAMVRENDAVRSLEPWIWILVGVATIPSVTLWQRLGQRIGNLNAYAVACLIEAAGVAASVEWLTLTGISIAAILLGGTFMGLTALGLIAARELSGGQAQRAIGLTTASFGLGQMVGPTVAGVLSESNGSLRAATISAAIALTVAALLAFGSSFARRRAR